MILLTGFEPFGGEDFNPSFAVARQAAHILGAQGLQVHAAELPCAFATAPAVLDHLLESHRPSVVISLGLAAGRTTMGLEKVAINHIDARIADNAGDQPIDRPVVAGAPAAYFATLPLKAALQALREPAPGRDAIEVNISYSAGSFVCNQVFYALMHRTIGVPGIHAGFIHVPWMDATHPGFEEMATAVAAVARLALDNAAEPLLSAGTEY